MTVGYVYLRGLRAARIDMEMSTNELAGRLGVAHRTINRWEIGSSRAPNGLVPKITAALGVTEKALLNHREPLRKDPTRGRPLGAKGQPKFAEPTSRRRARSDEAVGNENRRAYREAKKNPKECAHCGTKLSAYNRGNSFCYRHTSPDSRRVAS